MLGRCVARAASPAIRRKAMQEHEPLEYLNQRDLDRLLHVRARIQAHVHFQVGRQSQRLFDPFDPNVLTYGKEWVEPDPTWGRLRR